MLSKLKLVLAAAALSVASLGANAGAIPIGNVTIGASDIEISTGFDGVDTELLEATQSELEAFAGFGAGYLDTLTSEDVIEGSAIKWTGQVAAESTFSFDWVWTSEEVGNGSFNDFAFVSIVPMGAITPLLAEVVTLGNNGAGTFSFDITHGGIFSYVIGVVDVDDEFYGSKLGVSNLSPVPVPAAALLFGSALLGFAGFSARRKVS